MKSTNESGASLPEYIVIVSLLLLAIAPSLSRLVEDNAVDLCKATPEWYDGSFERQDFWRAAADSPELQLPVEPSRRNSPTSNPVPEKGCSDSDCANYDNSAKKNSCYDLWLRYGGESESWAINF